MMHRDTKFSGLIFDRSYFNIGWTYRITSTNENIDNAVLYQKYNKSLVFAIPSDEDGLYCKIKLTPDLVGSECYRFEHKTDVQFVNTHNIKFKV